MKNIIFIVCFFLVHVNAFDINSVLKEGSKVFNNSSTTDTSTDYKTQGLKQALKIGTQYATEQLSGNGFLNNTLVKIPLPKSLQSIASLASKVGGEKYVEDFVRTMNLAAGEAVPKTVPIFTQAIESMSIDDATSLLKGDKNSITDYFRKKTSSKLIEVINPIVKKATASNNLTNSYATLMSVANNNKDSSSKSRSFLDTAKNVANTFGINSDMLPLSGEDLNTYVTRETIDGMFTMIGKEEEKIRANPLNYSSDIIQKVFSK